MSWIQTHLTVDQSQVELVELLLEQLGAVSITLGDAGDEPMLEPLPGETPLWSAIRLSALFSGDRDIDQLRSTLNRALTRDISRHLTLEVLQDRDWARSWLDRFKPMCFGRRLWVYPTGWHPRQPDVTVVELDPGLAFGTGTHPTTRLCLEWLDRAELCDKTLIDFGCGSGILSVAALKLGARQVTGIDHDPQALSASRMNAQKNGVADQLYLSMNPNGQDKVHIILANILSNVLIDLKTTLLGLLKPGGSLVMSGILSDQLQTIIQHYATNVAIVQTEQQQDWCLLHVQQTDECEDTLPQM